LSPERLCLVITCEHGGNRVPRRYEALFRGRARLLQSHRGHDPGALSLSRALSGELGAPVYFSTISRLLVDLNRSPRNPRRFSEVTSALDREEKARIEERYFLPYRSAVEEAVRGKIKKGKRVLHLSVHSFAPIMKGKVRRADIGLLYDPSRKSEKGLCAAWREALGALAPGLRVRRNYPYRGTSDGLTAMMRKRFPEGDYLGIELEVNQRLFRADGRGRAAMKRLLALSLRRAMTAG
jgi:predicted N-formylglutamate amidohydrolase